jgi:hypothetical protein
MYVDDTFVFWPDGQEKLAEILNHISGLHHYIQFTMEKEESRLPFLDIEVYRKTDGSLGHKAHTHQSLLTPELTSPSCSQTTIPLFPDTQPQLSVTRIPSTKNCNFSLPFLRIMDTPLNRYDEP